MFFISSIASECRLSEELGTSLLLIYYSYNLVLIVKIIIIIIGIIIIITFRQLHI